MFDDIIPAPEEFFDGDENPIEFIFEDDLYELDLNDTDEAGLDKAVEDIRKWVRDQWYPDPADDCDTCDCNDDKCDPAFGI